MPQDLPSLRSAGAQPRAEARHQGSAAARQPASHDVPLQARAARMCQQCICLLWEGCCPPGGSLVCLYLQGALMPWHAGLHGRLIAIGRWFFVVIAVRLRVS